MPSGREWTDQLASSTVEFFIGTIGGHDKVVSVEQESQNVFVVTRAGELSDVRVWVCDVYTLGIADYLEITRRDSEVDAIVTMSGYNSWTRDAKNQGYDDEVGVFKFGEFMGALNYDSAELVAYKPRSRSCGSCCRVQRHRGRLAFWLGALDSESQRPGSSRRIRRGRDRARTSSLATQADPRIRRSCIRPRSPYSPSRRGRSCRDFVRRTRASGVAVQTQR